MVSSGLRYPTPNRSANARAATVIQFERGRRRLVAVGNHAMHVKQRAVRVEHDGFFVWFHGGALVRKGGLEPPRFYPPDPKSGASANSATFAPSKSIAWFIATGSRQL